MKAETKGDCFDCGLVDLVPADVTLSGTVRGEPYTVQMRGLKCPNCGYVTVEGRDMPEYGRLLADKYREKHGLLTSGAIRDRRKRLEMNQEQFADFLKVGVASVKRWELGKIQDRRSNQLIVDRTNVPLGSNTSNIATFCFSGRSTMQGITGVTLAISGSNLVRVNVIHGESSKQTASPAEVLDIGHYQTVQPEIADYSNRRHQERFANARRK